MYLYDAVATREADRRAMTETGIPGLVLMENAARSAADHIFSFYGKPSRVVITCGSGNNGADGMALARHLLLYDVEPVIILTAEPDKLSDFATRQFTIIKKLGISVELSREMTDENLHKIFDSSDLLVDGLLGTGAKGAPRGETQRIIFFLNAAKIPVLALDVPSGVDSSTGRVSTVAVKATSTVTFLAAKTGLFVMPGRFFSGQVVTGHIGVPYWSVLPAETDTFVTDDKTAFSMLPKRDSFTHKGRRGMVIIFGGSRLYQGAPFLAARGALRAGAGIVVVVTPEDDIMPAFGALPESIIFRAPSQKGFLLPEAYDAAIKQWGRKATSIIAGPGIGRSETTAGLVRKIWEKSNLPVCFDADALYFLKDIKRHHKRTADTVLTPHEGEAATLLGKTTEEISAGRLESVRALALKGETVILKGAGTIIDSGKTRAVIGKDHPCLSVPGSGDVLCGIVGAMLAAGLDSFDAAVLSAFLHAKAGLFLGEKTGTDGLLASQIADELPYCINALRKKFQRTGFEGMP